MFELMSNNFFFFFLYKSNPIKRMLTLTKHKNLKKVDILLDVIGLDPGNRVFTRVNGVTIKILGFWLQCGL
jgi:hypothetical protein